MEPTILTNVDVNSNVMTEEIFGPILPVIEFDNIQDIGGYVKDYDYYKIVKIHNWIVENLEYKEQDDDKLDIEAIYNYSQNIKNQNPHTVKARYIKGIEALNGK